MQEEEQEICRGVAMELSTPNKNQITTSTPLSPFENSPVFNYINNLSPIELVAKFSHTDQTFSSLSFASPTAVFTSPQLISKGDDDGSCIRRHQLSEASKLEINQIEEISAGPPNRRLGCFTSGNSVIEVSIVPQNEYLEAAAELPKAQKSDGKVVTTNSVRTDSEKENAASSDEICCSYKSETNLRKICRIQRAEDEEGCDWVTLISDVDDILTFDSSIVEAESKEQKLMDPGTMSFVSNVLNIPEDNAKGLENTESFSCVGSSEQIRLRASGTQSRNGAELNQATRMLSMVSGFPVDKLVVNNVGSKEKSPMQSSCKKLKVRRRCLVFEMAGACKKKSTCKSNNSILLESDCQVTYTEKKRTPCKCKIDDTLSSSSGWSIGLHLNTLTSNLTSAKVVDIEALASAKQEISQPPFSFYSLRFNVCPVQQSSVLASLETDLVSDDKENKPMENASQLSMDVSEEFGDSSLKTYRPKLEHHEAACKRCNCKRSKCLKLYCECFAAGLYCIEPCSCQDCFNNPAHEDTVLETRKQIESRNPLAFAPKVIRSMDSTSEFGESNSKTPTSARHKRGCNCRRSSCLKKYCECFQGGVGCSSHCRCQGCKNTFGSNDGVEANELGDESDTQEHVSVTLQDGTLEKCAEEHPHLLVPSKAFRSPVHSLATSSWRLPRSLLPMAGTSTKTCIRQKLGTADLSRRQPEFEKHLQATSENETPKAMNINCSSTSMKLSPNCKHVSPPHHGFGSVTTWNSGRKLILRAVRPFPSLNSQQ